jgi:ABC-type amino acid transport substrate-binding protein
MLTRRRIAALSALLLAGCLAGCGVSVPTDPEGTLDRVRGGELRAGASASGSLVTVDGDRLGGSLVELVDGFAASIDARVDWTVGSEEELVDALEAGELDLAVGGMTDQTPWSDRVAVTRGYTGIAGASRSVVILLPLGENAWQSEIERYLDTEVAR